MASGLYPSIGGMEACRELSAAFYARVVRDPVLRPLFPTSLNCPIEGLALFLAQFLGGPCEYSKRRWWLSLREAHSRFNIGSKEREAWLKNMRAAMDHVRIDEPARSSLAWFFEQASAYLINQPSDESAHDEIGELWSVQRTLEEAVAAVRSGDGLQAIALAESSGVQGYFERDRAAYVSLLAIMSGSGHISLTDYVQEALRKHPELVHARYTYDRTLLHGTAEAGTLHAVMLLLSLNADPNAADQFGHTPLYSVGNACADRGGDVVRALVSGGAHVDAQDKVKRCTALHMAARRGNVQVAQALLDCGANTEVRDIAGDTPLRRAVNCGKTEVAALLLSHGADVNSRGNRGLTVGQAARGALMKQLLETYAER